MTIISAQNIDEKWVTVFEKSDFRRTASYEETINYFRQFAEEFDDIEMHRFGVSPQGRELFYVIIDKDRKFDPSEKNKPVVLIENGIHSGEIEGKDACMLLLREIFVENKNEHLLDNITLIIIPVLNVDGHERKSKYNRINQNGPEEMGWRTTAQNYNLNRDFAKADAPEMRSLLKLFSAWKPEIFIDSHTTDGLDYQYVMTYGIEKYQTTRNVMAEWVNNEFINHFENEMAERGLLTAPYFSYLSKDYFSTDPLDGVTEWVSLPRFSHGYAAFQNRIGLLLETHMLKPYKDRVFATKAAVEIVLEMVNDNPVKFVKMIEHADNEAIENFYIEKNYLPLEFESTDESVEFTFRGFELHKYFSDISGSEITTYSNKKFEAPIKYYNKKKVTDSVSVPDGYIIPKEWVEIVDIMKLHGVEIDILDKQKQFAVETYKFTNVEFDRASFEGRQTVKANYKVLRDTIETNKGDYFISTNQRLVPLIVHLLEPKAADSFFRWGFFNSVLERKEYFEMYSMEPIAQEMIEQNPELKKEFEEKLKSDEEFRNDPRARLNFFYERSPYFDEKFKVYPVMRVVNEL
jgi:murein tripeptide amidase MpaA